MKKSKNELQQPNSKPFNPPTTNPLTNKLAAEQVILEICLLQIRKNKSPTQF